MKEKKKKRHGQKREEAGNKEGRDNVCHVNNVSSIAYQCTIHCQLTKGMFITFNNISNLFSKMTGDAKIRLLLKQSNKVRTDTEHEWK